MDQIKETGGEAEGRSRSGWSADAAPMADRAHAELVETVWACERAWKQEDRIDAVVRG